MRLDRFDLNLLVTLDALLAERNVTRAAARLHIGQSAASAALHRLREYFGDELLVRTGRRFELTPLGQHLERPVREVLLQARAVITQQPSFDPATASRRFSVFASDYVVMAVLSRAIRELAVTAPGFRLDLHRPPFPLNEEFERGTADLMIIPEQAEGILPNYARQVLFKDEHVCMVCSDNPLAKTGITLDQYMSAGHVVTRMWEFGTFIETWLLFNFGKSCRVECTVDNFGAIPSIVMGTQRISTLHRRIADEMALRYPVTVIPAPFLIENVEIMVWPTHMTDNPSHQWLRSAIERAAKGS